jgi:hypothetical protein
MIFTLLSPIDWLMEKVDRWLQKKIDEKLQIKDEHRKTFIKHMVQ